MLHQSLQSSRGQYLPELERKQLEKAQHDIQRKLENKNKLKLCQQTKQKLRLMHRRIQIMLLADEGKSQAEICQRLKCTPATANRWIMLASNGMSHQWQEISRGRPKKVNQRYLQRLKELVSGSPRDFGYPFQRWTGEWLARHLEKEFGIKVTKHHINRLLKEVRPTKIKDLPVD